MREKISNNKKRPVQEFRKPNLTNKQTKKQLYVQHENNVTFSIENCIQGEHTEFLPAFTRLFNTIESVVRFVMWNHLSTRYMYSSIPIF